MKKVLALMYLSFLTVSAQAAVFSCEGKVVRVMADHTCPDPKRLAYKTSGTGGANGSWICSQSEAADSLVLVALTTKMNVLVQIHQSNGNENCGDIVHYTPHYLFQLRPED